MAKDRGHKVVFSPPHHSDLQPIKLVWACVKGKVGRKYTTETTFKDVLECLISAFECLSQDTIQGCIKKANLHLAKLLNHIQTVDNADDSSDDATDLSLDVNSSDNNSNLDF